MPPVRHTRKSSSTTKIKPISSPLSSTPEQKQHDQPPNNDQKENVAPPMPINMNNVNTTPSHTTLSFDPALLDEEEEIPQGPTDTPTKSPHTPYAGGYNALKSFNGQVYSGMAIGGSHTWNYDGGVWKETKTEPDLWKIDYQTTKRRAKNAPTGSGAAVGTEYHWLIVAHQYVTKTDANTYETHLVGSKYKLAHKMAASNSWSVPTVKAQREREIDLLEDAKRRLSGLPPVLAGEKVKVEKKEKGQQKLDALFGKAEGGTKRKREEH